MEFSEELLNIKITDSKLMFNNESALSQQLFSNLDFVDTHLLHDRFEFAE
jgi:hypothetical protein